jgi:hypothetical protein
MKCQFKIGKVAWRMFNKCCEWNRNSTGRYAPTVVLRCRWEKKKCAWGLSSTQWYYNIFCVGKPKNQNVLTRAFRGRRGRRRPPSEGGRFWGWKKFLKQKKCLAFQLWFYVFMQFSHSKCLKTNICLFSAPIIQHIAEAK